MILEQSNDIAQYSASIDDLVTLLCFLHFRRLTNSLKTYDILLLICVAWFKVTALAVLENDMTWHCDVVHSRHSLLRGFF